MQRLLSIVQFVCTASRAIHSRPSSPVSAILAVPAPPSEMTSFHGLESAFPYPSRFDQDKSCFETDHSQMMALLNKEVIVVSYNTRFKKIGSTHSCEKQHVLEELCLKGTLLSFI
jgi:hypothetical protein